MALQIPPNCDLTLGLTCIDKSTPGTSVWRMRVDERFLNPAGIVQGGFICAMMDSSMGAAAVTGARQGKVSVANTEVKTSFVRPARAGAKPQPGAFRDDKKRSTLAQDESGDLRIWPLSSEKCVLSLVARRDATPGRGPDVNRDRDLRTPESPDPRQLRL